MKLAFAIRSYRGSLALTTLAATTLGAPTSALGQWQAIAMHPANAGQSVINAVTASSQAGTVEIGVPSTAALPALWSGTPSSWISLAPQPGTNGDVYGATEGSQVGSSTLGATLWHGSPQSAISLHPVGLPFGSVAFGVSGDQQVGVYSGVSDHALLWRGSAASVVDLHPAGATNSEAYATDGTRQGGRADFGPGISAHAVIWNGSAQGYIDLNPGPGIASTLFAMAPGQQVGFAAPFGGEHAALWSGTAASYVDLHPPGAPGASALLGTTGSIQVGRSHVTGATFPHAGVWFGTAASFIDLHQFLPPGFGTSYATSIADLPGGGVVIGGWAAPVSAPSDRRAFIWTNVPAPASGLMLLSALGLTRRRPR